MDHLTLGLLLNILIVPQILGSSSPGKSGFLIVPKSNEGFSTFSNVESTKLNPNGATVRQWETRTWITTIPLHKIVNLKANPLEAITHLPVTKSSSSSKSSLASPEDHHYLPVVSDSVDPFLVKPFYQQFNLTRPPSSSENESVEGEEIDNPGGKPTVHRLSSFYPPYDSNVSCFGDSCSRKSYQGTYDTINYSKESISPEIKSLPRYSDEPAYSKTSPYRYSSSDDHNDSDYRHGENDEDEDKTTTRSKANIAWARIQPPEIHSTHYKTGRFTRTGYYPAKENSDLGIEWKARREYLREAEPSPPITTLRPYHHSDFSDSSEINERSNYNNNHSSRSSERGKLTRSQYRSQIEDYHPRFYNRASISKLHRENSDKVNQNKRDNPYYRSKDYPSDDIGDKLRSSEDQSDRGAKIFSKTQRENDEMYKDKKSTPRVYHYHHDHFHSGEAHEVIRDERDNDGGGGSRGSDKVHHAGHDKDDKGYYFEPTNLSGHFSSSEVTDTLVRDTHRPYKKDPFKLSRKSSCHCLSPNSARKLKRSDESSSIKAAAR